MRTTLPTAIRTIVIATVLTALHTGATEAQTPTGENGQQGMTVVSALFEYPMAPEELQTLEEKSEWLMEHFWDALNFKNKHAVDQAALNHAFNTYIIPMQWASKESVEVSTDNLLKKLSKNPTLLLQFTKAAEDNLYDPTRSKMLIDEVYVKYLAAITANKKIDKVRKIRYADQLRKLQATMPGHKAPEFSFTDTQGQPQTYHPMSTFTIIEFGDPTCTDCRMAKLKMDVNRDLEKLVEQGKVNILFILPDTPEGWQEEMKGYPRRWSCGASDTVDDIYDIRLTPTIYTIGGDGNILSKNITVERAIQEAIENTASHQ